MFDAVEYSSTSDCCFADLNSNSPCVSKKKRSKNERRFNDDQIRSLEIIFQSETKLEPRKKLQLAKELGLQPRQVAIWFQNKRARWKSKQIEKDYVILLANYDALASQFDSLKKENQSLLLQLQKLKKEVVGKPVTESPSRIQETAGNSSSDEESDNKNMDFKVKNNITMLLKDDSSAMKAEFLGMEGGTELLRMVEPAAATDSSLTSSNQDWVSLDSDDLIINKSPDQTYQWWDFGLDERS